MTETKPTFAVAADHAGLPLKQSVIDTLVEAGYKVEDLGAFEYDALDDYPDYTRKAGRAIQTGMAQRAVMVCGSGVGACVAANKMRGVRAGLCHDTYSARQGVEHDDVNMLCLGGRIIGIETAREVVKAFADARFSGEDRHVRRLQKVNSIEAEQGA